jgi:hypothetical protein
MLIFEVLTGIDNEDVVFWDMTPCSLVDVRVTPEDGDNTSSETSVTRTRLHGALSQNTLISVK